MSTITPLPTPPSRSRPTQFSAETDAFLSALATFVPEVNQVASEVDANATTSSDAASTATAQAENAAVSASAAEAFAAVASVAADVVEWGAGTSYLEGSMVWSPLNYQTFRAKNAISGTTDPSLDTINWEPVSTSGAIARVARTSNTPLNRANLRNFIDITSGTFTQTFDSCTSLGSGWWCIIRNSGTGDITLDPNSSETIDGLTSFIMYPGEVRLVQCDGSCLRSVVLQGFYKVCTVSGIFVKPPGYQRFAGLLWGGGGSGMKNSAASNKVGGGGGACTPFDLASSAFGASETYTIGDGGTAITTNATVGNAGGASTIGSLAWAGGGNGGGSSFSSGGDAFFSGTTNAIGQGTTSSAYGGGASHYSNTYKTIFGGAGGGGITSADALENGHSTIYGGDGGDSSLEGNGGDGVAPGGGGGATKTGTHSGAGARGELRIWGIV